MKSNITKYFSGTAEDDVGNLLASSLMLLDGSTGFEEINYRDSNVCDNFDSTLNNGGKKRY